MADAGLPLSDHSVARALAFPFTAAGAVERRMRSPSRHLSSQRSTLASLGSAMSRSCRTRCTFSVSRDVGLLANRNFDGGAAASPQFGEASKMWCKRSECSSRSAPPEPASRAERRSAFGSLSIGVMTVWNAAPTRGFGFGPALDLSWASASFVILIVATAGRRRWASRSTSSGSSGPRARFCAGSKASEGGQKAKMTSRAAAAPLSKAPCREPRFARFVASPAKKSSALPPWCTGLPSSRTSSGLAYRPR
mmetsp:Transcript_14179/g.42432  ORF Transcript_14179/g.42432 Transcript_14179/m.42432 type:complete len:251 (-) Transcript_14179:2800-3552(-)